MEVKNLKLMARTEEDMKVVSAHLQDSIANVADIANLEKTDFSNAVKQIYVGRC